MLTEQEFEQLTADSRTRIVHYRPLVQTYYAWVSDIYRQIWGPSYHFAVFSADQTRAVALAATERMIADDGAFRPGMRVLDIGCGIGGPALHIARYSGAHVTGVDIIEEHIETARQRATEQGLSHRTAFECADGMHLPFPDETFDGVYIFEAGCHMPDKPAFYRECARMLRAGGVFLGVEWMRLDGLTLRQEMRYIDPICRYFAVPHLVNLSELRRYLLTAGLSIEVLENVASRGNVMRNWEPIEQQTQMAHSLSSHNSSQARELLKRGGMALAEAAYVGAFILGYWRARKPEPGQTGHG